MPASDAAKKKGWYDEELDSWYESKLNYQSSFAISCGVSVFMFVSAGCSNARGIRIIE